MGLPHGRSVSGLVRCRAAVNTSASTPPAITVAPRTLFARIWEQHLIFEREDGTCLLWIDRHLVHEVTSPQAFDGLREAHRRVRCPHLTLAVADHNVPTIRRDLRADDPQSSLQVDALRRNCREFGIEYIELSAVEQGIVHVVGPEQGFTLPGATVACGDSHTSTHGAFGALAFGIGTSEVEHILATQTLWLRRPKCMRVRIEGRLSSWITAKDIALAVASRLPAGGASGHVIEYCGTTVESLSMEARMTLCNMAVEVGARAAIIAPDKTTFDYLRGRPRAPGADDWPLAMANWQTLRTDDCATFDRELDVDASAIAPHVSWGTSSEDVIPIDGAIPSPLDFEDPVKRARVTRSLDYMGLTPGAALKNVPVQNVFIGSCTNARIEDLRAAAEVIRGKSISPQIRQALVVPGSGLVKKQAELEGLDRIFIDAGFEWRDSGCSMCVAMNADRVPSGERCASTSNRNFMGRQGPGSRTHLMSPPMAAAAAITGRLTDVRELLPPSVGA